MEEYHEIADQYIDDLVLTLEETPVAVEPVYDVEYSVGPHLRGGNLSHLLDR